MRPLHRHFVWCASCRQRCVCCFRTRLAWLLAPQTVGRDAQASASPSDSNTTMTRNPASSGKHICLLQHRTYHADAFARAVTLTALCGWHSLYANNAFQAKGVTVAETKVMPLPLLSSARCCLCSVCQTIDPSTVAASWDRASCASCGTCWNSC